MAWLVTDPIQPVGNALAAADIEAPFVGAVGIPIQAQISQRELIASQIRCFVELNLHNIKRFVATFQKRGETLMGPIHLPLRVNIDRAVKNDTVSSSGEACESTFPA